MIYRDDAATSHTPLPTPGVASLSHALKYVYAYPAETPKPAEK